MSVFTFSTARIGSTDIANTDFVYGKGVYDETGLDAENTTADGWKHHDRMTKYGNGRMVLYGNKISLATPDSLPALSYAIVMTSSNGTIITRTGVVTRATFTEASQSTTIDFSTDPYPPTV